MNGHKPLLRLLIVVQTFLLFSMIFLPALVHYMHQPLGKWLYGAYCAACITMALLLRRPLQELE